VIHIEHARDASVWNRIIPASDTIRPAESAVDAPEIPGITLGAGEDETGQTKSDMSAEPEWTPCAEVAGNGNGFRAG